MPIVIHGTWIPDLDESFVNKGQFFLWFETRDIDTDYPNIPDNLGKLFPYACPLKNINKLIKSFDLPVSNLYKKSFVKFLLPTCDGKPIASLAIKKYIEREEEITLSDWAIPGIELDIDEAIFTLSSFIDFIEDPEEFIIGDDLTYWISITSYVENLVKSEQFLPDLVKNAQGDYYALWKFAGDPTTHKKTILSFTDNMPGICKNLHPGFIAKNLVEHFISVTLDHFIRNVKTSKIIEIILRAFPDYIESDFIKALLDSNIETLSVSLNFEAFYQRFNNWLDSHQKTYDIPFRLCFKLEEPEDQVGNWIVRFLLQGRDDPSLIVSAHEIWQ
ncbi:MAG TPA: hypothetical protein GX519_00410, partial [Thermoanaerobacterales bacterium]|nr:hypothetical protein [Thermoanaerobacterales bacterium]